MTHDDLRLLVDYNYWARDRILDAVSALTPGQFTQPLGNSFSSIRDTIAHICDAESIWIRRWNGEQPFGLQNPERIDWTTADLTNCFVYDPGEAKAAGSQWLFWAG